MHGGQLPYSYYTVFLLRCPLMSACNIVPLNTPVTLLNDYEEVPPPCSIFLSGWLLLNYGLLNTRRKPGDALCELNNFKPPIVTSD